jgi:hypothetical protein
MEQRKAPNREPGLVIEFCRRGSKLVCSPLQASTGEDKRFELPYPIRAISTTMSRIFEALKLAQLFRSSKAEGKPPVAEAPEVPDRRKSPRWALDVAVYVYGHGPGREPFHEEAHTLNVSTNGALLLLSVPVQHTRTVEAGVEFSEANPDFWHTARPVEIRPTQPNV